MFKTKIRKGDKVVIIRGQGALAVDSETQKQVVCTVLKVMRDTGRALLEMPRPRTKRTEKATPLAGVEQWKTARYNPKTGEAGGLKIVKRPVHVSNLQIVEKGPAPRDFKAEES
jgi:ribosomal protein L24